MRGVMLLRAAARYNKATGRALNSIIFRRICQLLVRRVLQCFSLGQGRGKEGKRERVDKGNGRGLVPFSSLSTLD